MMTETKRRNERRNRVVHFCLFLTFDTNRHFHNHLIHLFMLHYHQMSVDWFYDIVTYQNISYICTVKHKI